MKCSENFSLNKSYREMFTLHFEEKMQSQQSLTGEKRWGIFCTVSAFAGLPQSLLCESRAPALP